MSVLLFSAVTNMWEVTLLFIWKTLPFDFIFQVVFAVKVTVAFAYVRSVCFSNCECKICFWFFVKHKFSNSITFSSDITAPCQKEKCHSTVRYHVRRGNRQVFLEMSFMYLPGIKPVLARLWSLAFPCTASACGVACLLPVCVRGSLAWFIGPWHTALWTPPLLLEWLFHVLMVHPPGWFSTDGGQMWSCSRARGNMPCRQCGEKLLSENVAWSQFLLKATSLQQ